MFSQRGFPPQGGFSLWSQEKKNKRNWSRRYISICIFIPKQFSFHIGFKLDVQCPQNLIFSSCCCWAMWGKFTPSFAFNPSGFLAFCRRRFIFGSSGSSELRHAVFIYLNSRVHNPNPRLKSTSGFVSFFNIFFWFLGASRGWTFFCWVPGWLQQPAVYTSCSTVASLGTWEAGNIWFQLQGDSTAYWLLQIDQVGPVTVVRGWFEPEFFPSLSDAFNAYFWILFLQDVKTFSPALRRSFSNLGSENGCQWDWMINGLCGPFVTNSFFPKEHNVGTNVCVHFFWMVLIENFEVLRIVSPIFYQIFRWDICNNKSMNAAPVPAVRTFCQISTPP